MDRLTKRKTDLHIDRQIYGQMFRKIDTQLDRLPLIKHDTCMDTQTDRQTFTQTVRHTDRYINKPIRGQMLRQIDR